MVGVLVGVQVLMMGVLVGVWLRVQVGMGVLVAP